MNLPNGLPDNTIAYCQQFTNQNNLIQNLNNDNQNSLQHINNLRDAILNDKNWGTNPANTALANHIFTITGTLNTNYMMPLTTLTLPPALPQLLPNPNDNPRPQR